MNSTIAPPRAPGRPRDAETETRILQVALRLLAEQGYSRMSLDAVAAESGTSKPTIYRRWSSKADLATAALNTIQFAEPPVDTGSSLGDLTRTLEQFSTSLLRPNGMSLIGTALAEESHTPELLAVFRARLVATRRGMLHAILLRAQKRKELRPAVNLDCAVNMLVGAFYARYLATSTVPPDFAGDVVGLIWKGIASPATAPSRPRA